MAGTDGMVKVVNQLLDSEYTMKVANCWGNVWGIQKKRDGEIIFISIEKIWIAFKKYLDSSASLLEDSKQFYLLSKN